MRLRRIAAWIAVGPTPAALEAWCFGELAGVVNRAPVSGAARGG